MATPSAAVSSAVTGRAAEIRELDSMLGDLSGRGLMRVAYRTWDERRASADADGLRTIYLSMSGGDRRAAETETLNTIWESTVETYASQVLAAHARIADPNDPEDMARAQLRGQFYSIAVKMALASNSPCSGNFRLGAYATHDLGFGTGVYPTSGTSGTPASAGPTASGASPATPTPSTAPAAPAPTASAAAGASGSITLPTISGPGYTFLLQPGVPVLSMQELAVYTNRAMRALLEEDGSGQGRGSGTQAAQGIVARGRARAAASPPTPTTATVMPETGLSAVVGYTTGVGGVATAIVAGKDTFAYSLAVGAKSLLGLSGPYAPIFGAGVGMIGLAAGIPLAVLGVYYRKEIAEYVRGSRPYQYFARRGRRPAAPATPAAPVVPAPPVAPLPAAPTPAATPPIPVATVTPAGGVAPPVVPVATPAPGPMPVVPPVAPPAAPVAAPVAPPPVVAPVVGPVAPPAPAPSPLAAALAAAPPIVLPPAP